MDQHFFGGPVERCTSRNIRTFARGFEAPTWGPGVAEGLYEVPAGSPGVIDGASGVPAWGSESETVDGGLETSSWPAWSLEVVAGGGGPPT
jgi:hypothetical protein